MEISLGRLRVALTPIRALSTAVLTGYNLYEFKRQKLEKAHKFYSWDCEAQTGVPMVRRPNVTMRTHFEIPDRVDVNWFLDIRTAVDTDAQWVAGAGFSTPAELVAETQTKFPPVIVPVDWDKLWQPIKDQYSFDLYVTFRYLVFLGRPAGMHEKDYMFLAVPQTSLFYSIITGRCTGILQDGAPGSSDAQTPSADQTPEAISTLYEAHEREAREAEAIREDLEGEFPGFPSEEEREGF